MQSFTTPTRFSRHALKGSRRMDQTAKIGRGEWDTRSDVIPNDYLELLSCWKDRTRNGPASFFKAFTMLAFYSQSSTSKVTLDWRVVGVLLKKKSIFSCQRAKSLKPYSQLWSKPLPTLSHGVRNTLQGLKPFTPLPEPSPGRMSLFEPL